MSSAARGGAVASRLLDHPFAVGLCAALEWSDPHDIGREFRRGTLGGEELTEWLLTADRLYRLVCQRDLQPPQLRFVRDGDELHPNAFLSSSGSRRGGSATRPDPRKISTVLQEGATLVLDALDEMDERLAVACRALQWWAGEVVQVNAYLTTGPTSGFRLHWDDHDVVIIQVSGTKAWDVRGMTRRYPMRRDAVPNTKPPTESVWTGELRPGDVMHLPRGQWHAAAREDEGHSLHLTFGITRRTGVDWLLWAADRARRIEGFRQDLPNDPRALHDFGTSSLQQLESLLEENGPATYLRERRVAMQSRGTVYVPRVDPTPPQVVCVTDFPPVLNASDTHLEVLAEGTRIALHPRATPAATELLSGMPVDVAALSAACGIDVSSVVQLLLEHGICAVAPESSSSAYTGPSSPVIS